MRVVEEIVVCAVVVGIGNIVKGLRAYLIDGDLSAYGEAQDDGVPMINTVTNDNRLDVVGIKIIPPVNIITNRVPERILEARVVDFEHWDTVFSQVGIVEKVANPNTVYF